MIKLSGKGHAGNDCFECLGDCGNVIYVTKLDSITRTTPSNRYDEKSRHALKLSILAGNHQRCELEIGCVKANNHEGPSTIPFYAEFFAVKNFSDATDRYTIA